MSDSLRDRRCSQETQRQLIHLFIHEGIGFGGALQIAHVHHGVTPRQVQLMSHYEWSSPQRQCQLDIKLKHKHQINVDMCTYVWEMYMRMRRPLQNHISYMFISIEIHIYLFIY